VREWERERRGNACRERSGRRTGGVEQLAPRRRQELIELRDPLAYRHLLAIERLELSEPSSAVIRNFRIADSVEISPSARMVGEGLLQLVEGGELGLIDGFETLTIDPNAFILLLTLSATAAPATEALPQTPSQVWVDG
jgi:hypothetical protein